MQNSGLRHRYWCHRCSKLVPANQTQAGPSCSTCFSYFIEEVHERQTQHAPRQNYNVAPPAPTHTHSQPVLSPPSINQIYARAIRQPDARFQPPTTTNSAPQAVTQTSYNSTYQTQLHPTPVQTQSYVYPGAYPTSYPPPYNTPQPQYHQHPTPAYSPTYTHQPPYHQPQHVNSRPITNNQFNPVTPQQSRSAYPSPSVQGTASGPRAQDLQNHATKPAPKPAPTMPLYPPLDSNRPSLSDSASWVQVPSDDEETENTAQPSDAAPNNTQEPDNEANEDGETPQPNPITIGRVFNSLGRRLHSATTAIDDAVDTLFAPILDPINNQRFKRKPPADPKAVENLPTIILTHDHALMGGDCCVCLSSFSEGDEILLLPCKHSFCKECIQPWLRKHNSCPLCRFELPTNCRRYERLKERQKRKKEASLEKEIDNLSLVPDVQQSEQQEVKSEQQNPESEIEPVPKNDT
mmetsp:Transcript_26827/g.29911  ORF Transcript_26827/g.29911 Transcript_26827/m.29911 type:complete len:464 (+) Transcript_26827:32-1423(+)